MSAGYKTIGVIGSGSWGTALAMLLAGTRSRVRLWSHTPGVAQELIEHRTNQNYLPGVRLPPNVYTTTELSEALQSELILVVTPSRAIREVAAQMRVEGLQDSSVLVSCTKGIEHDTGYLMTQVLEDCLPGARVAVLSGPNHAEEIARGIPAATVIGSKHQELLPALQATFNLPTLRPYTSEDIVGIQLGGALKNIFAIAAGVSDGFNMGDNAKAGLVTRSLAEMMRLGIALGGKQETFFGLSGVGDLMVTCFSQHSRNRLVGEKLGRGEAPEAIEQGMKMVAEGVPTSRGAYLAAEKLGVDVPITHEVHAVLHEGKPPHEAMWELLGRPPKPERESRALDSL